MSHFLKIGIIVLIVLFLFRSFQTEEIPHTSPSEKETIEKIIVAFGDSLTEGYEVDKEANYPSQLQQKLIEEGYVNCRVVNLGRSGDTTRSGVSRIDEVFAENPDIVILALGANDGLHKMPLRETRRYLREMITAFQAEHIEVLLVGIKFPFLLGVLGYTPDYEEMYEELAEEFHIPLVPSLLEGVLKKPELNLPDEMHPNKQGYAIVAKNVWEELEKMLLRRATSS